jgi:hypothetical protein
VPDAAWLMKIRSDGAHEAQAMIQATAQREQFGIPPFLWIPISEAETYAYTALPSIAWAARQLP